MASNYTTNYELPLWGADDAFLRTEFNDAHEKIEDALTVLSEEKICIGSYVGDGTTGRIIQLPFTPKFVIVMGHFCSGPYDNLMLSIITEQDSRYIASGGCGGGGAYDLLLQGSSLKVQNASYNNTEGKTVYYIAVR